MFRNCLAVLGAIFLVGIFRPQIVAKVPALAFLPLPTVTIQWGSIDNNPGKTEQANSPKQTNETNININNSVPSPTPSPTPKNKRWGIHFEMKSNIGDQSDK